MIEYKELSERAMELEINLLRLNSEYEEAEAELEMLKAKLNPIDDKLKELAKRKTGLRSAMILRNSGVVIAFNAGESFGLTLKLGELLEEI